MEIGIFSEPYHACAQNPAGYERMKRHGYDCTDFSGFTDPRGPAYQVSDAEAIRMAIAEREAAERAGIRIHQVHGPWPTDDTTEENRKIKFGWMTRAIRLTEYTGAKYLVIHPDMPYGWDAEDNADVAWDINMKLFTGLLPYAEDAGVTLCIENMPMTAHALSRTARMLEFVKEIDHPLMGMCLDTGHAILYGDGAGDMVRMLGDTLKVLHVHDNDGRRDLHMLPYTGVVDWEDFRTALRETNFAGVLSLETGISDKMPEPMKDRAEQTLAGVAKYLAGR